VPALLVVVTGASVGLLVYTASALITFASRRSVLASLAIAVSMALGFMTLVAAFRVLIAR